MEINGSVKTKGRENYGELGKRLETLSFEYLKDREKRREIERKLIALLKEIVEKNEAKALKLFYHYFLIKNVETSDEFLRDASAVLGAKGAKILREELKSLGMEERRVIRGSKKRQIINFLIYSSLKAPNEIKEMDKAVISLFGNEDRLIYEYYRKLFVEVKRSPNGKEVREELLKAVENRVKQYVDEKNYSRAYRIITLFKEHFPLFNSLQLEKLEDLFIVELRKLGFGNKELRNARYFFSKYRKDLLKTDSFNKKLKEVGREKFPSLFRKKAKV